MIIKLQEIPKQGKNYIFSHNSGELNKILNDLIDQNDYLFDFLIKPVIENKSFEIHGKMNYQKKELCVRCCNEFVLKFKGNLNELLIKSLDVPRNHTYSKYNNYSEVLNENVNITHFSNLNFNIGELLYEILASSLPYKALCDICNESNNFINYDEPLKENSSPFKVLNKIKK